MQDFYNIVTDWNNTLNNSFNSRYIQACATCEAHKSKGFNREESSELLMSKGFGDEGTTEILNAVYGKSEKIPSVSNINLFIVPTKYSDVQPMINYKLSKYGPEKLISYLVDSEIPIIQASEKYRKQLIKIAESVLNDPSMSSHLHEELEPYFEETMLNSVLMAENETAKIKKLAQSQYEVDFFKKSATVDLEKGASTGTRFTKGNFGKFGIADEFLVKAHDSISPYNRLIKVIIRK